MKLSLPIILFIFSISCYARFTDYIDGKWYSCDAWTVNDAGDTLFQSKMCGFKVWYSYNKKHQQTGYRMSDGTTCKISYTLNGRIKGEDCSDGGWYRKKYNSKGQVVLWEDWRTLTIYEYDNLGNEIYSKTTRDENWGTLSGTTERWNEYNSDNILVKTIYSSGEIDEFYNDGTAKYRLRLIDHSPFKEWFDLHGYVVRDSSKDGDYHYENRYDQYGMIVYEGRGKRMYKYFSQDNTIYKCISEN